MANRAFVFDERLGILLPRLRQPFKEHDNGEKQELFLAWENIRGGIPSRITELEQIIEQKLIALSEEEDFASSCKLNEEIAETASIINDLHIWYRITRDEPVGKRYL